MSERIRGSHDDALYKSMYTLLTLLLGFPLLFLIENRCGYEMFMGWMFFLSPNQSNNMASHPLSSDFIDSSLNS